MSVYANGIVVDFDNATVSGLAGTEDSLAYKINELEKHIHNTPQHYGSDGAGNCTLDGLTEFIASAGNGAWGREDQLHDGTVFESGDATKKFDFGEIYVTAVGTANRPLLIELLVTTQAGAVALDGATNATNVLDLTGHSLNNGDKIMLSTSVADLPNGLVNYTVYYVVNKNANDFQVSYTVGGAAVTFSDDGTGTHSYHTLTQARLTTRPMSFANTNTDARRIETQSRRTACDKRVTCRAKADGGTNTLDYLFGIHIYDG